MDEKNTTFLHLSIARYAIMLKGPAAVVCPLTTCLEINSRYKAWASICLYIYNFSLGLRMLNIGSNCQIRLTVVTNVLWQGRWMTGVCLRCPIIDVLRNVERCRSLDVDAESWWKGGTINDGSGVDHVTYQKWSWTFFKPYFTLMMAALVNV